jgi:hypothetical protein
MAASLVLTSCGGSDEEVIDPKIEVAGKLKAHEWKLSSVSVGGIDKTEIYEGMTINFATSGYTAASSNPIFLPSGSWSVESETKLKITPAGEEPRELTIIEITDSSLKISVEWDETTMGGGRPESLEGNHIFHFIKG